MKTLLSRWLLVAALVLLVVAGSFFLVTRLRGWSAFVDSDQIVRQDGREVALEPGQPAGQTFVARHAGLTGVEFFLLPQSSTPLSLTLHLWADPQSGADLVTASVQLPAGAQPGFYHFAFPPMASSHAEYYYAFLDAAQSGISLGLAQGDAYLDGAAYQVHQPLDAQATFRLVYAPGYVALDLLKAMGGWVGLLVAAGLLFVVPGWALLAWLWPGRRLAWAEMLGLAAGASLALYPLLFLWTDLVGLHLGPLYAWLPMAAGLAALAWRYRSWRPRHGREALRQWGRSEALWPDLTLLVVIGLVYGVRLLAVRSLDAPMWGDSYQHTMIAQLLVDSGGLFDSWQPYAEMERFTYHFGFHSAVAVLHWLTGLRPMAATLWGGQILNGLAVLTLYPLALRVARSRWAGVWAVLLAGLLSPMPMFYVNWGRYTQLAGQVILPAAVWLTWAAVDLAERKWRLLVLTSLVAAGLALTHYRVLIFYCVFVLALMLVSLRRKNRKETWLRLVWIGAGAGLLYLPWFMHTLGASFLHAFWKQATTPPAQAHPFTWEYNAVGSLDTFLAPVWWLALILGLGLGLWRRQRSALLAGTWFLLLLVATNPGWLSLPGTGIITNFALFIAAYLPASLLSGNLAQLARPTAGRAWFAAMLMLVLVSLGIWGARERLSDLDPARYALITRPDVRAAAWIQENTSQQSRFLVNSFFAYGGSAIVGSDAGWWLPLLAGRRNTVPPATYGTELAPDSLFRREVEDLAREVQTHDLDDPALVEALRQQKVTHVYVGQRQGRVNWTGPHTLTPTELLNSPCYRPVYHQDRVWIFEIDQSRNPAECVQPDRSRGQPGTGER
jgi:hypothetical protein